MLTIPLEKLAYIVEKAREYDAEVPADPDAQDGSDAADDDERRDPARYPGQSDRSRNCATRSTGSTSTSARNCWHCCGSGAAITTPRAGREALRQARDTRTTTETDYLLGTPLLGDYLEEGVEALGLSLEGFERG